MRLWSGRTSRQMCRELVCGNDELGDGVTAHPINGAGGASAYGVGIAAGTLGGHRDRLIGTAHNSTYVIEWIGLSEIDDKTGPRRTAAKRDSRADLNAEGFVRLGVRDTRLRGGVGASTASDVD